MSSSKWDKIDIVFGDWVYLNKPGHQFHLQMFQAYYDGHDTYTLLYGKRMVVCNRVDFVPKGALTGKELAELQVESLTPAQRNKLVEANEKRELADLVNGDIRQYYKTSPF